jgi:hypothetical protein
MGLIVLAGCGSSSSTTTTTTTTTTPVANSVTVAINSGPANNAINSAYVTVQVCSAGATTSCATINDVQVDTGSSGLRILASSLAGSNLTLNQVTAGGTPVYECFEYAGGNYLWGPVEQAGLSMAGESATNVPIQIIASGNAPSSVSCASGGGTNINTPTTLRANGILGIGPAAQDCGDLCTGTTVAPVYWACPSSTSCTSAAAVPTATQVSNPVGFFNGNDNNGVMLTMNSLGSTSGAATASGILYFGIGTQTDNALSSSVKAYALASNTLEPNSMYATYNGVSYPAYVDSAESFVVFLDPATAAAATAGAGITSCTQSNIAALYCPTLSVSLPFTTLDASGDSAAQTFTVGNGATLYNSSVLGAGSNTAFSNLAGGTVVGNDEVVLGMPFFYGRTVYVGIAGKVPPSSLSTSTFAGFGYWAF